MVSTVHSAHPASDTSTPSTDERSYYNISQAAALLGVSRMSIWRWIRAGRLPVARLGHRTTRIRREDLERLMAERGPATAQLRVIPDGSPDSQAADGPDGQRLPRSTWGEGGASEHIVQFYEADTTLVEAVSDYLGVALHADEAGIVIATAAHRDGIEARLRADGLDLDAARAGGHYVALDAADTLAKIAQDGEPRPDRFAEVIGTLLERAAEGGRPVRAFGEMVALLAAEGNHTAAIRLEGLWNELHTVQPFGLFCAYPIDALSGEAFAAIFDEVCTEHARVIPAEGYTALEQPEDRLREIARLQQQAASLRAEVAERKRAEERLRQSQRELRDFVENATEGLHWVGPDGEILWANRAELELLGYTPEEYIGRHIAEFHADADVIDDILCRLGSGDELHNYEARLRAKDGTIRHVLINSNVYREDGRFVHTRCFTRDITERKRTEREREELLAREQQARAEAEAALRLRDEFLSVASHELRTPLATLKGHAQVALRRLERAGQLEPERVAEALRAIASQSDKLNRLLGHLLDISRLQAGNLALERLPTDLTELVRQVVEGARARTTGHPIMFAAPPSLRADVDSLRLEQVLTNLLDNASKYSPEGGPIEVTLGVRCQVSGVGGGTTPDPRPSGSSVFEEDRPTHDSLEISVRDHGLGIAPEKRDRIFERFYQAHSDGYRSGLGLGLYISRQIVELHGGQIAVEFPPEGGSRFVVRLPLTPDGVPLA